MYIHGNALAIHSHYNMCKTSSQYAKIKCPLDETLPDASNGNAVAATDPYGGCLDDSDDVCMSNNITEAHNAEVTGELAFEGEGLGHHLFPQVAESGNPPNRLDRWAAMLNN